MVLDNQADTLETYLRGQPVNERRKRDSNKNA
jgi:hypothetical protein